jgi:hypothetical protein
MTDHVGMSDLAIAAHQHLRRLLAGGLIEGRRPRWTHALALMKAAAAERSSESESLMREIALFDGKFLLVEEAGLPHAMSPEDMLRSIAAQTLASWDLRRHRDVIRHVARTGPSGLAAAIVRQWV